MTSAPTTCMLVDAGYRYRPAGNTVGVQTFELIEKPAGMQISRGQIEWPPSPQQAGAHRVVLRGLDADRPFEQSFALRVATATHKRSAT